jgi:hypothetical protein
MTVNYNFKLEPFEHQKQALTVSRTSARVWVLHGDGNREIERCYLDNIGQLYLAGLVNFALIIAPKGVYRNWVTKEIPEHMSDDVTHRVIRWVASPNKKQQEELKSVARSDSTA